jgi:hypothetical protein
MKAFITEPKKYLLSKPWMPYQFRTLIMGPQGCGKQEVATELKNLYGW